MKKELLKGLTKEQLEKASRCKNTHELLEAAKSEGIKLTDEQLAAVNGGCIQQGPRIGHCPQCGAQVTGEFIETTPGDGKYHFQCYCGHNWVEK